MAFPRYEAYRDSGVGWLGEIPVSWKIQRLGTVFDERKEKVSDKDFPPLSVTKNGVLPQLETAAKSDDGDNRKGVREGDFVINSRSDRKGSSGIAKQDGSVSLINIVLKPKAINPGYCEHLLKSNGFIEEFYRNGHGIVADLWTTRYWDMKSILIPLPDLPTQDRIANFLDQKTTEIDEAIAKKQRLIELLKEQKAILINRAVTKGLNPDVPMRDSGVEWIGEVPVHWEVRRSKFVFTQRKEFAWKDDIQLSATQEYGVIPQEEYENRIGRRVVKIQFHLEKRKHVELDDFVISMRSFQGGLERAWARGCIRSSYVVLRSIDEISPAYYSYLLKSTQYIAALQSTANFIRDGQDLNFENFSMVDLLVVPLQEQTQIAEYLDEIVSSTDRAIHSLQQQIDKIREYRASLISNTVTGKIKI